MGKGFGTITYIDIADFTRVKCDVNTPPLAKATVYSVKLLQPGTGG